MNRSPAQWLFDLINANTYAGQDLYPDAERTPYDVPLTDDNLAIYATAVPTIGKGQTVTNRPQGKVTPTVRTSGVGTAKMYRNGHAITRRTDAMLRWAEKESGLPFVVTQGSWLDRNTHRGEAIDLRTWIYTPNQLQRALRALKDAGFAAWYREPGWAGTPGNAHIHAIPIGGRLDPQAAWQVTQFDRGRSGLTANLPDSSYRPSPRVKFDYAEGKPVRRR